MTAAALFVVLATTSLVVASMLSEPARIWLAIGFVVLAVGAAQQETLFGDDTALSATMIVVLAAVGSAVAGEPVWVVGLCGLLGGLNAEHVRCGAMRKLAVNSSCTTIAALMSLAAAWATQRLGAPSVLEAVVSAIVAAVVYWVVDNCLIAVVLTVVDGRRLGAQVRDLLRSETRLVSCAALGFVVGYAGQTGALPVWATVAALVVLIGVGPIVIARRPFLRSSNLAAWWLLAALVAVAGAMTIGLGGRGSVPLAVILGAVPVWGVSAIAMERTRSGRGSIAPIVGAVAGASFFHGTTSLVAALVFSLVAGLGVAVVRRSTLASAAGAVAGALAIVATIALVPFRSGSLTAELVLGVAIGTAYLVAVHAVAAIALAHRVGRDALRAAASLMRIDADVFLLSGLLAGAGIAAIAGRSWIGAIVFVCVVAVIACRAATTRAKARHEMLSDEQLLDVVQSAILMLPASRLPDEL
jgi:hypothetical protein